MDLFPHLSGKELTNSNHNINNNDNNNLYFNKRSNNNRSESILEEPEDAFSSCSSSSSFSHQEHDLSPEFFYRMEGEKFEEFSRMKQRVQQSIFSKKSQNVTLANENDYFQQTKIIIIIIIIILIINQLFFHIFQSILRTGQL